MVAPVISLFHIIVPEQFSAVSVAFSVPHTCVLLAVMVGAAGAPPLLIVTDVEAGLVPQVVVQVAVYVPAPTSLVVPVVPSFHVTVPVQLLAVSVAFSVPQTCVLLVVTLGAVGVAPPLVMVTELDATLVPQEVVQVAV